jgi:hypothetical protein
METSTNIKHKMTYAPFSKYLKLITGLCSFGLILVATVNYTVDPGNIYPSLLTFNSHNKLSPKDIVRQFVQSDHGVIIPNDTLNERDIKKAFALNPTTAQCAIIGSSRVMQISSAGQERSLTDNCPSLINLGVSGASLEDYLVLSGMILQNEMPPRVIVFGIDPLSFNFNSDARWIRYKQDFFNMRAKVEEESNDDNYFPRLKLLQNLINREYLQRSVRLLLSERILSVENAPEFDHQIGLDRPVLLPDGSLIYSSKHNRNALTLKSSDINTFRIRRSKWVTEKAVELFIRLVNHLQQQKIKVIFVLPPYPPTVWTLAHQSTLTALITVELKVHEIARLTGVQVIGSYKSDKIGCTDDEFFDAAHEKAKCLTKLERVSTSYHLSKK